MTKLQQFDFFSNFCFYEKAFIKMMNFAQGLQSGPRVIHGAKELATRTQICRTQHIWLKSAIVYSKNSTVACDFLYQVVRFEYYSRIMLYSTNFNIYVFKNVWTLVWLFIIDLKWYSMHLIYLFQVKILFKIISKIHWWRKRHHALSIAIFSASPADAP